ncbi:MAG: hypothetical protein RL483_236 [Pseudomonadota bacterium]
MTVAMTGILALGLMGHQFSASPLASDLPACESRDRTVKVWRSRGHQVFTNQALGWCVVSSLRDGRLVAQQWRPRRSVHSSAGAEGWEVEIPLALVTDYLNEGAFEVKSADYPGRITVKRLGPGDISALHREAERLNEMALGSTSRSANLPFMVSSQLIKGEVRTVMSFRSSDNQIFQIVFRGERP